MDFCKLRKKGPIWCTHALDSYSQGSCHSLGVSMHAAKKEREPHCLQATGDFWHHWISNDISYQ